MKTLTAFNKKRNAFVFARRRIKAFFLMKGGNGSHVHDYYMEAERVKTNLIEVR